MAALGLAHLLVGRSHECKFPPSLLALPCVSSPALGPDIEQQSCATVHDRLVTTGRGVTEEEAAAGRASCVALRRLLQQQLRQAGAEAFIAPAATGFPPPLHQVYLTPAAGGSSGSAAAGSCTHEGGTADESKGEGNKEYHPVGVTLIGIWNEDERLLDVAMELERFLDRTSPL
ncbi:unnamed protein product [Closterium sp. Naga37s-1]|nr:unnamed protein product [Closterium sp. Naga37s-1]